MVSTSKGEVERKLRHCSGRVISGGKVACVSSSSVCATKKLFIRLKIYVISDEFTHLQVNQSVGTIIKKKLLWLYCGCFAQGSSFTYVIPTFARVLSNYYSLCMLLDCDIGALRIEL